MIFSKHPTIMLCALYHTSKKFTHHLFSSTQFVFEKIKHIEGAGQEGMSIKE